MTWTEGVHHVRRRAGDWLALEWVQAHGADRRVELSTARLRRQEDAVRYGDELRSDF